LIEARRIVIEQGAHVGGRHRARRIADAKPGETERRAMPVIGVGRTRPRERLDRSSAVAEPLAHLAEPEPGGGKIRRPLDRLREQIGGGLQIATRLEVARMLITAIGDQVAGGEKERS
jgi:hypothetical protein